MFKKILVPTDGSPISEKSAKAAIEFAAINKAKPSTAKGRYITNAAISLTMSPSITLDNMELMDIK